MKRYFYPVYSDTLHLDCLLLLYTTMFAATFFFNGNRSHDLVLVIVLLVLTCCILPFSSLVVIDKRGISVHRLLCRKLYISWDIVSNWGIVTKKNCKLFETTYIYFSTCTFVSAPWEKMPRLSSNIIFLSYKSRIKNDLAQIGITHIAKSLPPIHVDYDSKLMKPKIKGTSILLLLGLLAGLIAFLYAGIWNAMLLIIPSFHFIFLVFSTVDWN